MFQSRVLYKCLVTSSGCTYNYHESKGPHSKAYSLCSWQACLVSKEMSGKGMHDQGVKL